jgi:hypothetical protein
MYDHLDNEVFERDYEEEQRLLSQIAEENWENEISHVVDLNCGID